MCSLSWRRHGKRISLFFTRDESVHRPLAELPKLFVENGVRFLMPKDPQGAGSWLAVNEFGLVIALLNDYQGQLKPITSSLRSRGLLVRALASCRSIDDAHSVLQAWPLALSQPFQLALVIDQRAELWRYNGSQAQLESSKLPPHLFSSGHVNAAEIIEARNRFVKTQVLDSDQALLALHRCHEPVVLNELTEPDLAYSFCMHRDEARSQSLSQISLEQGVVRMRYWNGQPCLTDQFSEYLLKRTEVGGDIADIQ